MASIQSKSGKTGKKTFYVVVSVHGKHKWLKAGTKQNAVALKKQVDSLENSQLLEKLGFNAKDMRVDDFFEKYSEHIKLHTSTNTAKRYISIINTFLTFIKMFNPNIRYLSQIKTETMESYQQKRLKSLELKTATDGDKNGTHKKKILPKPQTVNYELSVLRSAFIWAKDREYISVVPTKRVKKLKPKGKREPIILTPQACKLFLKTIRDMAKENSRYKSYLKVFQFLLNTGLRSGELCNLTWDDVDLKHGTIKIQAKAGWTPKTYEREFYLNVVALSVLNRIKERNGYIFKSIEGNQFTTDMLRNALLRISENAGLKHFTRVHDLRHTFSSLMQIKGVDRATVGEILGHEDEKTTRIYSHTYKEHLKKSMNLVGIK